MTTNITEPVADFENEKQDRIKAMELDKDWRTISNDWMVHAALKKYMYNFSFMGRPIIQLPQDMVAMQEIIWETRPDLIVETGIAHGGSLIMSAGMLALLDYCDAIEAGEVLDPRKPHRRVLGIDIDIRAHNRKAVEDHPLAGRIDMIQGSSIDPETIDEVKKRVKGFSRILVCLDSNHTHDHVLAELDAYAPLTSRGCYCIVFDTIIEDLPSDTYPDRPWTHGNNPKTAVHAYLQRLNETPVTGTDGDPLHFVCDHAMHEKLLLTVTPDGFLKRV